MYNGAAEEEEKSPKSSSAINDLAQMTMQTHYSRTTENGGLESWKEIVKRVFDMHETHLQDRGIEDESVFKLLEKVQQAVTEQRVYPSGRSLQFGGDSIMKNNLKIYNCSSAALVDWKLIPEALYLLLCGCGVGISLQQRHISQLPAVKDEAKNDEPNLKKLFVVEDNIEGWADALKELLNAYMGDGEGFCDVVFDFSEIRNKGARIGNIRGTAPGPDPLKLALENVRKVLERRRGMKLRSIDLFDILAFGSDCVLSGGIRRSAMILVFSPDDELMMNAKVGNWFVDNPQRARANISAMVLREELTPEIIEHAVTSAKQYGEPGLVLVDGLDGTPNPCCEIIMRSILEREDGKRDAGFGFCNLTSINVTKCSTKEEFFEACEYASALGTVQATYDKICYLRPASLEIMNEDRLLGVCIDGVMQNTAIALDPSILEAGAKIVRETNDRLSQALGINGAARLTAIKPSGTSSVVLGLSASGCHPVHADRYIRRVQVGNDDTIANYYALLRAKSTKKSVWSENSNVVSFPVELDPATVRTKQDVGAIELLDSAKLLQKHWVSPGFVPERNVSLPYLSNSVSLTVNVKKEEWNDVSSYILRNCESFTGISLLGSSGDVDYAQAPFERALTVSEMEDEFGDTVTREVFKLVEDIGSDVHELCRKASTATFEEEKKKSEDEDVDEDVVRVVLFCETYFDRVRPRAIECIKRAATSRYFDELVQEVEDSGDIDWSALVVEDVQNHEDKQEERAKTVPVCSGGSCVLVRM